VDLLTEYEMREFFSQFGSVRSVSTRGENGGTRGFGFVEFWEPSVAAGLLIDRNMRINGVNIWCDEAKPKPNKRSAQEYPPIFFTPASLADCSINDIIAELQKVDAEIGKLDVQAQVHLRLIDYHMRKENAAQRNDRHVYTSPPMRPKSTRPRQYYPSSAPPRRNYDHRNHSDIRRNPTNALEKQMKFPKSVWGPSSNQTHSWKHPADRGIKQGGSEFKPRNLGASLPFDDKGTVANEMGNFLPPRQETNKTEEDEDSWDISD